ncbi:MAG: FtsX-like permease family protein [Phycisphaerales bacterium]
MGVYVHLLVRRYLTTRIIPLIAVGAVALCVALVIVVVSVMSGFLDSLRSSGRTLMGDVVVSVSIQGIPYYEELIADIERLPGAAAAAPLLDTYGLVKMPYPEGSRKSIQQAQVWGIEPESLARVTEFRDTIWWKPASSAAEAMRMGSDDPRRTLDDTLLKDALAMRDRATGRPGAMLGIHVSQANERQRDGSYRPYRPQWWMPNNEITVTLVPVSETGKIAEPRSAVFKVVNEVMSGVYQVDKARVFIPLKEAQEMVRMDAAPVYDLTVEPDADGRRPLRGMSPARVTQILVRAKPGVTPRELRDEVATAYEQFYLRKSADPSALSKPSPPDVVGIETWEQRLRELIGPVEKERQMMRILFSITYVVCAGLILAIFWSIVGEKTRDIGIMRAMGAGRGGVMMIFLRYGLVIGVVGSAVGTLVGWVVIRNINTIHEAMGHDAPPWLWGGTFLLALGSAALAVRGAVRGGALPFLLWSVATLALVGTGVGLCLHRGFLIWDPAVYYFTQIPSRMDWETALGTSIGAIVFSVLGAAVPAARAADIDPVRALRYE